MITIREGEPSDAECCAEIYRPYVTDTVISFEDHAPSAGEMAERMLAPHVWLVAEVDGVVVGYAYGARHRERAAYRWTADVAVYVDEHRHRAGVGRALYSRLFHLLKERGFRMLCAGVTQPNPPSNALHEALGFELVGTYRRVGWKHGAWHDVRWYQLDLHPADASPPPLR